MNEGGWIKLHRKVFNNPVVTLDADHLAVWMYLLLNATHKEIPAWFDGKKITLEAGQLITGRKAISKALKISESKVYRILSLYKSEHQIEQQTCSKSSLITIVKWHEYQNCEQQNEQQMNNKRTASEHKQEIKEIKNKRNNNSFNNFQGRLYDYKALEEMIIYRGTK